MKSSGIHRYKIVQRILQTRSSVSFEMKGEKTLVFFPQNVQSFRAVVPKVEDGSPWTGSGVETRTRRSENKSMKV